MNQTIDIKTPIKCTMCNSNKCQTTWIIIDNKISKEITTRDCEPSSYNKLPKWIYIKDRKYRSSLYSIKNKYIKDVH